MAQVIAHGVSIVTTGRCLAEACGWSAQGSWATVDSAAAKHNGAQGPATAVTTGRYPVPTPEDRGAA